MGEDRGYEGMRFLKNKFKFLNIKNIDLSVNNTYIYKNIDQTGYGLLHLHHVARFCDILLANAVHAGWQE